MGQCFDIVAHSMTDGNWLLRSVLDKPMVALSTCYSFRVRDPEKKIWHANGLGLSSGLITLEAFLADRSAGTQLKCLTTYAYNNKIFRLSHLLVIMALQSSLKHHLLSAFFP